MNLNPLFATLCLLVLSLVASAQTKTWKKYTNAQGAFTAEFPGEPKVTETTNQTPEGFNVKVRMHAVQEPGNVCYVLYNEMQAGVNILDDSTYLNTVTAEIIKRFGQEAKMLEKITFEGVPGRHFVVEFADGIAEGKIVLRTNRAYFVVGFFPASRADERKRFLESFRFLPYQQSASIPYQSKDHFFKINFPAQPKLDVEEKENGSPLYAYYALDPQSGNNYSVAVDSYSPYMQFESDSAVLANRVQGYTLSADSVISIKDVIADGRPAKELIIHQGTNNFKMRVRVFTNGNFSYTIFTFLPYDEIVSPHVNQFFDSFRFTARVPGNLLSDKSELMLHDIESNDTIVLKAVLPFIENHDFSEKHTERIHELLTKSFDDDRDTISSRKMVLLQSLAKIESPSSIQFIQDIFPTLKYNHELEYHALNVLARLNSRQANELILELLPKHTAVRGNIWKYSHILSYHRIDSAEAKPFFLQAVPLLSEPAYKTPLYAFMEGLLRDNRLSFSEVGTVKATIFSDLKSQYEGFEKDTIYQYLDDLASIAGYEKPEKATLAILKKLASQSNEYLAIRANASLLRLQQKANDKRINDLAKNIYFRKDLFSEFRDFGLEKFFPKDYLRQDSIAISEFFAYIADEYVEPAGLRIVHSEVMDYTGTKKKFFVLEFTDPEDGSRYRGVAGPYATNKLEVFGELTGSFFEEDQKMSHHDYLEDYIQRYENP